MSSSHSSLLPRAASLLAALVVCACAEMAEAPSRAPDFEVVRQISSQDGSYDYVSVDPKANSLFVGRDTGVLRVDLKTTNERTILHRNGVAAVLIIPGTKLMLATHSRGDAAILFDRNNGSIIAEIPTGKRPDGAAYDASSGLAFVMSGRDQDVTVIDVALARALARIPIGGVPEAGVVDRGQRLYVNVEDRNEVAVVDVAQRRVADRFALPGCIEPTGIAFDEVSGLVISACHNRVTLLTDARTGANRAVLTSGEGADGVVWDASRRRVFVPAIDGTLTVFLLDARGHARHLQTVVTRIGARTAALHASTGHIFLPSADVERNATGDYLGASKNFRILEVAPIGLPSHE